MEKIVSVWYLTWHKPHSHGCNVQPQSWYLVSIQSVNISIKIFCHWFFFFFLHNLCSDWKIFTSFVISEVTVVIDGNSNLKSNLMTVASPSVVFDALDYTSRAPGLIPCRPEVRFALRQMGYRKSFECSFISCAHFLVMFFLSCSCFGR